MKPRRRLGCGCLFFLVLSGVSLLLVEWFLRANTVHFLGAPSADWGKYRIDEAGSPALIPGWRGTQTVDGVTTQVAVNELGLRGGEIGPRQPGELRVLALGDSFVHGHGVADDETFAALLGELLSAKLGVPVVVGNGGVNGCGTADLENAFERYRVFDPQLIIACSYLGNDFEDDTVLFHAVVEGYRLGGPMARMVNDSWRLRFSLRYRTAFVVERFLRRHVPALAIDTSAPAQTAEEREVSAMLPPPAQRFCGLFLDRRADGPAIQQVVDRYRASFSGLHRRAAPIPVLAVLIPSWWHLSADVWAEELEKRGLEPEDHEKGRFQRRLVEALGTEVDSVVDLTPMLRDADQEANWFPQDRHWSAAGHRRVAGWLVDDVAALLRR